MADVQAPWLDPAARKMFIDVLAAQLRHILTGGAGILAAHGMMAPNQETQTQAITFVSSAILYAAGAGWAWWQKTGREQFIARVAALKFEADERTRKAAQATADHKAAEAIVQAVNSAPQSS